MNKGKQIVLEKTDSTNEEAKRQAEAGAAHGTVILAREQTLGRGRRGRSWHSPAGDSIYMSLLLRPVFAPDRASMLTLLAALAVSRAVEDVCGLSAMIKWPNDLLVQERKICGILTEMGLGQKGIDYVIIGIGVNVDQKEFPDEIRDRATSLQVHCPSPVDRERLIQRILEELEVLYNSFCERQDLEALREEYNRRLINVGRQVKLVEGETEETGLALGINEMGELLVRRGDGTIRMVSAGEVSVRGVYGYV